MHGFLRRAKKLLLRTWYRKKFKSCGTDFRWDPVSSFFARPGSAEIGDHVFLGEGFHISVAGSLKIGDGVVAGPRLIIMGGDHDYSRIGKRLHEVKEGINLPVVIERDVWIGARVTILKGVTIGEGAVIGAGSLVTKDILPYTIAVGTPAKAIKKRFSDEELSRHLEILDYSGETIAEIIDKRNRHLGRA
jgi:acetyltransferase-like isoleucine patch superfamily enzyme